MCLCPCTNTICSMISAVIRLDYILHITVIQLSLVLKVISVSMPLTGFHNKCNVFILWVNRTNNGVLTCSNLISVSLHAGQLSKIGTFSVSINFIFQPLHNENVEHLYIKFLRN